MILHLRDQINVMYSVQSRIHETTAISYRYVYIYVHYLRLQIYLRHCELVGVHIGLCSSVIKLASTALRGGGGRGRQMR